MKLNAKALADNEAKKPAARGRNEDEKEDSVVTPIQPSKKPSPPFVLRKRDPMASALLPQDEEDEQGKVLYEQERLRPMNVAFDPKLHKNLLPVELSGFRVHMIVKQDEDAPRIPKHTKKGIKQDQGRHQRGAYLHSVGAKEDVVVSVPHESHSSCRWF